MSEWWLFTSLHFLVNISMTYLKLKIHTFASKKFLSSTPPPTHLSLIVLWTNILKFCVRLTFVHFICLWHWIEVVYQENAYQIISLMSQLVLFFFFESLLKLCLIQTMLFPCLINSYCDIFSDINSLYEHSLNCISFPAILFCFDQFFSKIFAFLLMNLIIFYKCANSLRYCNNACYYHTMFGNQVYF